MLLELIKGVSLLLALSLLLGFNKRIWSDDRRVEQITSGCLFGAICVVGMLLPLELVPGVIFDARSVILSMAGLFGGPVVGVIAGGIAGAYRVWLGGGGVYVGTAIIVSCVLFGLAYRHCSNRGWVGVGAIQLLVFGLFVHLFAVLLFTQLPADTVTKVMNDVAVPFAVTFTLATPILGLLLLDIENRLKTETALRESEARLSLHIQNTPLAAVSWDEHFLCTQWNKAAEEIFGYTAEEALGQHGALIIPEGLRADLDKVYRQLLEEQGGTRNTNENITKDGRTVVCEWYNTPIRGRDGRITGVASLALDITDRRQTELELQRALLDAEQANQAKSEFLARLSHEFRTPLNAIIGFSEILLLKYFGTLGAQKYEDYAQNIHDSGKHLLELINDVLDISAIEAGKRSILKELVRVDGVALECIETVRQSAERRSITLSSGIPQELPVLYVDRLALKQILLNLLSNAIKFSEPGGDVAISATATANDMTIAVSDKGIGIAPDVLPTVTDVFSRGNSNAHLAQEGTGLGLAIVKSLVDAHGGDFGIESVVGKGTTVRVVFPLGGGQIPAQNVPI